MKKFIIFCFICLLGLTSCETVSKSTEETIKTSFVENHITYKQSTCLWEYKRGFESGRFDARKKYLMKYYKTYWKTASECWKAGYREGYKTSLWNVCKNDRR